MKKVVFLLVMALFLASCDDEGDGMVIEKLPPVDFAQAADQCNEALFTLLWNDESSAYYFNNSSGSANVFDGNYWPQAHGLDVLVDAYLRTGSDMWKSYMEKWLTGVKRANGDKWTNSFIDDMQWIGLATLRAYQATGNVEFLNVCLEVWNGTNENVLATDGSAGIKNAWTEAGGGGIFWEAS